MNPFGRVKADIAEMKYSSSSGSVASSASQDSDTDVDSLKPLEEQCYYHGVLPREEINKLLEVDGEFVVRKSRKGPNPDEIDIIISVFWAGKHYHIIPTHEHGEWKLEEFRFSSIPVLVYHYYKEKIPVTEKSQALLLCPRRLEIWQLNNDHITLEKKLGSGTFGDVHLGTLRTQTLEKKVAVKTCIKDSFESEDTEKFLEEAHTMRRYNHPNIVKLYGVAATDIPIMLVMEYIEGGSLDKYLRKNIGRLSNSLKTKLAIMAARGMEYLESKDCIHRDLAARNCLIDGKKHLKLSDFGLSRHGEEYRIQSREVPLPIRWTPPEVFEERLFSHKSDVWSYGVLVWEIFSEGEKPYSHIAYNYDVIRYIKRGKRLTAPRGTPKEVYKVMKLCWNEDSYKRPAFVEIRKSIERFYPKVKSRHSSSKRTALTM